MEYHKKKLDEGNITLSSEEKIEFEKEKLALEDAVYEFFQANKEKLEDPT
jgi:uncharacterized protein YdcH (DUF465 family)